ncbi:MAG: hypothetical protein NW223_00710 [Hyphomicrobiaceae bacterium]|nr:hypothetical protein [Hyphomicrobiaceae bacterium]
MRIGFTGHRPNRLLVPSDRLAARIGEAVDGLLALTGEASRAPGCAVAIALLAEGSDRIFAQVALARGLRLHALLPFPTNDYEKTFQDASTTPEYRRLLTLAAEREELPGSLADTKAAYEAVGRAMVEACDVLMAVWDGKPAAGRGGTPDVIAYALQKGRSVVWIDAAQDRPAVRLIEMTPVPATAPFPA